MCLLVATPLAGQNRTIDASRLPDLSVQVSKNSDVATVSVLSAFSIREQHELVVELDHPTGGKLRWFNAGPIRSFAEVAYANNLEVGSVVAVSMASTRLHTRNTINVEEIPASDMYLTGDLAVTATWGGTLSFTFRSMEYVCARTGESPGVPGTPISRTIFFDCNLESVKSR